MFARQPSRERLRMPWAMAVMPSTDVSCRPDQTPGMVWPNVPEEALLNVSVSEEGPVDDVVRHARVVLRERCHQQGPGAADVIELLEDVVEKRHGVGRNRHQ